MAKDNYFDNHPIFAKTEIKFLFVSYTWKSLQQNIPLFTIIFFIMCVLYSIDNNTSRTGAFATSFQITSSRQYISTSVTKLQAGAFLVEVTCTSLTKPLQSVFPILFTRSLQQEGFSSLPMQECYFWIFDFVFLAFVCELQRTSYILARMSKVNWRILYL